MTGAAKRVPPALPPDDETDGRRRRGSTSRARIVDAVMQLVREGDVSPGAARVAAIAGVGLRTVFRHFADMDSLYGEIAEVIQARVLPTLSRPYRSKAWRERLEEMVDRRIELYEEILPYKISGDVKRFQSPFLMQDYRGFLRLEKASLEAVLPPALAADDDLVHALRAATGFQAWHTLRRDLDLPPEKARKALHRGVAALVAAAPGSTAHEGDRP